MRCAYREWLRALPAWLRVWVQRRQGRSRLVRLDDRALRDIGLSRLDALSEGRKPSWRA